MRNGLIGLKNRRNLHFRYMGLQSFQKYGHTVRLILMTERKKNVKTLAADPIEKFQEK
jgi:hypothetical protein